MLGYICLPAQSDAVVNTRLRECELQLLTVTIITNTNVRFLCTSFVFGELIITCWPIRVSTCTPAPWKYKITVNSIFMFLHYLQVRAAVEEIRVRADVRLGEERHRFRMGCGLSHNQSHRMVAYTSNDSWEYSLSSKPNSFSPCKIINHGYMKDPEVGKGRNLSCVHSPFNKFVYLQSIARPSVCQCRHTCF